MTGLHKVTLADIPDQTTSKQIAALNDHREAFGDFAAIGGLATYIRLANVHRLTEDVDTVSPDRAQVVELLISSGAEPLENGFLLNGEIPVDIINVPDPITNATPPLIAARRWGLDNSSLVEVTVTGPDPVTATLPVSDASALISMKAHALHYRDDPYKRATDAIDIAALVNEYKPGEMAAALSGAPGPLSSSTLFHLHSAFVTNADVTITHSRLYANATNTNPVPQSHMDRVGDLVSRMRDLNVSLPTLGDMEEHDRGIER